jgi:hypothetical protein
MSEGVPPEQSRAFMEMTRGIEAVEEHPVRIKLMERSANEDRAGPNRSQERLDRDCKTPSRLACRALEGADFMTRLSRLDASQPHRLATLGTRENSDLRAAV